MEIIEFKGKQLQMNSNPATECPWIEPRYHLPNGNFVVEQFMVLESGQSNYSLIKRSTGIRRQGSFTGAAQLRPNVNWIC